MSYKDTEEIFCTNCDDIFSFERCIDCDVKMCGMCSLLSCRICKENFCNVCISYHKDSWRGFKKKNKENESKKRKNTYTYNYSNLQPTHKFISPPPTPIQSSSSLSLPPFMSLPQFMSNPPISLLAPNNKSMPINFVINRENPLMYNQPVPPIIQQPPLKIIKLDQCANKQCDHKEPEENAPTDLYEEIDEKKLDLDYLIKLGNQYHCKKKKKINNISLKILFDLIEPLTELKNLIGMEKVKKSIVNQIIFFLQDFQTTNTDMLHTIITGSPGVGKTLLGRILGKVYQKMGFLKRDYFKVVKRSDLIGQYLGTTAKKTQKEIDDANGGILFLDEAYALGNAEGRDSYSKEAIDTINQNLSENKNNFICIIAGYEDSLDKCFFAVNEGLRRRFSFKYSIEPYTAEDLMNIFLLKVNTLKWSYNKDEKEIRKLTDFFKKNYLQFPNFGGDIETLMLSCKITHAKRTFSKHPKERRNLNIEDIENGFKEYLVNRNNKDIERKQKDIDMINSLFI